MIWLRYQVRLIQLLNDSTAWLIGVAFALIALHLQLYWRFTGNFNYISIELIGWSAVGFSLWCRRDRIVLKQERVGQFCGWFLIALMLVRGLTLRYASNSILGLNPLMIGIAIAGIAVGFQQCKHYLRELLLIAVLAFPLDQIVRVVDHLVHASILTAQYSHALMWYCGFLVQREGTLLLLPSGTVDIYLGCSGLEGILISLKIAVFFLLVYPTLWKEKLFVPAIAILSAFIVNGFRIMLLACLVANKDTAGFEYWHGDQGAQIFSMISMTIFSSYCQFLIDKRKRNDLSNEETQFEKPSEALEHSSR